MSQQLELLTENPNQWATVVLISPEIRQKEIKPYVRLALKELEGEPDSRTSSLASAERYAAVRAVVKHVARVRSAGQKWGEADMQAFLEGLRFTPECSSELSGLLCTDCIYSSLPLHLRTKPRLLSLTWRIDVSLSQSAATTAPDALRRHTHIILALTTEQAGRQRTRTYRLTVARFHELRFVVASALKNMIVLQRRKCMKD